MPEGLSGINGGSPRLAAPSPAVPSSMASLHFGPGSRCCWRPDWSPAPMTTNTTPRRPTRHHGAPEPATSTAAFEFAECMRDNGIEDFPDPQIRADGDYFLEPPAGVGDDELKTAETACEHILGPPSTGPPSNTVTSPPGGSGSCRAATVSARTARSSASGCVKRTRQGRLLPAGRRRLLLGRDVRTRQRPVPDDGRRGSDRRGRNLRLRRRRATRSPTTPSSTSPTARVTCTSATPPPNTPPGSRCSTRATSTAPPPSTTSPQRFPAPPRSWWSARAPARSPRRCTAASSRIGFRTPGSRCWRTDRVRIPTCPA